MMFGSVFYNFWAAIIGFSLYFFSTLSKDVPLKVLIGSFIAAIISFLLMYAFRFAIAYILHTPEENLATNRNDSKQIQPQDDKDLSMVELRDEPQRN